MMARPFAVKISLMADLWGGDGGRGGNVARSRRRLAHLDGLITDISKPKMGKKGMTWVMHGTGSRRSLWPSPSRTTVRDAETGKVITDLVGKWTRVYCSPWRTRRARDRLCHLQRILLQRFENGEPGQERELELNSRSGRRWFGYFPSVGDQLLLSVITSQTTKIGLSFHYHRLQIWAWSGRHQVNPCSRRPS